MQLRSTTQENEQSLVSKNRAYVLTIYIIYYYIHYITNYIAIECAREGFIALQDPQYMGPRYSHKGGELWNKEGP